MGVRKDLVSETGVTSQITNLTGPGPSRETVIIKKDFNEFESNGFRFC